MMKRAGLALLAAVAFSGLIVAAAPSAQAAPALDIPGIDTCAKDVPLPQLPDAGLPGIFVESPDHTTAPYDDSAQPIPVPADPAALFGTSGMGGMMPFTYDQGCNFLDASAHLSAWTDREFSSYPVAFGQAFTALGDSIDRRAWKPAWVTDLLGDLSNRAADAIEVKVLVPFLGLGLLVASIMLMRRAARGQTAQVAQAVAWTVLVLAIGAFVLWSPTRVATATQAGAGKIVGSLYAGSGPDQDVSPAQASTENIMQTIHYNGWLRRTFGSDTSGTARHYGPLLLATTRLTWQEEIRTDPDWEGITTPAEREAAVADRVALIKAKQKQFENVTEQIKHDDPIAYQWVKGGQGTVTQAMFEASFAFLASGIRIAADLLVMLAVLLLVGVGVVWLLAMAVLVTPAGEGMGRGLLNAAARAVGYALEGGIAAWLWSLWAGVVLAPGEASWWAFVLLAVSAFIFWTVLRPDRKALSLLTAGKVRGNGRWTRWAFGRILTGVGAGWAAAKTQGKAEREQWRAADARDMERREAARHPVGWSADDEAAYRTYFAKAEGLPVDAAGRIDTRYAPVPAASAPVPMPAPVPDPGQSPLARHDPNEVMIPLDYYDRPQAAPVAGVAPLGPTPPPAGTVGSDPSWWRGSAPSGQTGQEADKEARWRKS